MKAPLYRPATAFVPPRRIAGPLGTHTTAIADLRRNPAAWAIVNKEIPHLDARIGNDMIKPHLGNFSFRSLIQFGIVAPDALDRIDAQFEALAITQ